jgi:hypothetical protein
MVNENGDSLSEGGHWMGFGEWRQCSRRIVDV